MINLFPLVAFVQFIGAFNFANVFSRFQNTIFKHFLNTEKAFNYEFRSLENDLASDIESIEKIEPIKTNDSYSNETFIKNLQEEYQKLKEERENKRKTVKHLIEKKYKMKHSSSLFLCAGFYCLFDLLVLGLLEVYKNNFFIIQTFMIYNILYILLTFYLLVCEITYYNRQDFKTKLHKFFFPSLYKSFKYSLVIPVISILLYYLNNIYITILPKYAFSLSQNFTSNFMFCSIILPFSAFIICFVFLLIYYNKSKKTIEIATSSLKDDFKKLHEKKKSLDQTYSQFSSLYFNNSLKCQK